jgi:hypothetical protein
MCGRTDMAAYASFILGLPGETPQTLKETLSFAGELKRIGLSYGFHLLAPFPGTDVRERKEHYGIHILTSDWSRYHANEAIVETASIKAGLLNEIVTKWRREYDDYLGEIQVKMQQNQATAAESFQVTNLERIVLVYQLMMNSTLEKHGSWVTDVPGMREKPLTAMLVDRIKNHVRSASPAEIAGVLKHALQQGDISVTQENGKIRWQWTENISKTTSRTASSVKAGR